MPKPIKAYSCASCGKLNAEDGKYISIVDIEIRGHTATQFNRKTPEEEIILTDVIVCDNNCLARLINLKGFELKDLLD